MLQEYGHKGDARSTRGLDMFCDEDSGFHIASDSEGYMWEEDIEFFEHEGVRLPPNWSYGDVEELLRSIEVKVCWVPWLVVVGGEARVQLRVVLDGYYGRGSETTMECLSDIGREVAIQMEQERPDLYLLFEHWGGGIWTYDEFAISCLMPLEAGLEAFIEVYDWLDGFWERIKTIACENIPGFLNDCEGI